MIPFDGCYWNLPAANLLESLSSGADGLSRQEAERRLSEGRGNTLKTGRYSGALVLFLKQFKSPITLLLIAAALLSFFLGERPDAYIILAIILVSALLGFYQEKGAAGALRKLLQLVQVKTTLVRDGQPLSVAPETVVPGDIILLKAGETIPGDCRLIESKELYSNEASLTGETFPVEKKCGELPQGTGLAERNNCLFMGTHVISGTGKAVVVHTVLQTEFGAISQHLRQLQPETEFERGIRRFGYLLLEVTLMLMLIIFSINVFLHKPVLDSFLFSLAIAVGLTPQLLPAIISINLARGASNMARQSVIIKRLSAIENFGSMDVLCCDKTGTLTTGEIILSGAVDYSGKPGKEVFRLAYLNAFFEQGFTNPIDEAIRKYAQPDISGFSKIDELPYDFIRRRLSILVGDDRPGALPILVTKGAFDQVLSVCGWVDEGAGGASGAQAPTGGTSDTETPMEGPIGTETSTEGRSIPMEQLRQNIRERYTLLSRQGYRILGVAYKKMPPGCRTVTIEDETAMTFMGMLLLTDPPKADIRATLDELKKLGIGLKVITGDNPLVAAQVAREIGLPEGEIITGGQIRDMNIDALSRVAGNTHLFAGIEPNQKEKILLALKKAGHVTGYMGDGINDAPALHIADVGISVSGAADVAKEAADIVLLGNDLKVLAAGVREGRKTFANTLKYIFMATSANFGNMFSMAGASLFLSYLPLLPKQVLLTNLLTDIPEMTIATDAVDPDLVKAPRRIDLHFIGRFMIVFGIISSVFDFATFGVLFYWLKAGPDEFRTGWFLESVVSASLIVLVVRTSQVFYHNRPGKYLLLSTLAIVVVTILLPYTPLAALLGFVRLPLRFYAAVGGIVVLYVITAETAKRIFYGKVFRRAGHNARISQ